MANPTALRALAERMGVLSTYEDNIGVTRPTDDETRVALLAAMGIDAASESEAATALAEIEERSRQTLIEPVVVQPHKPSRRMRLRYRPPPTTRGRSIAYRLELEDESGETHVREGRTRPPADQEREWASLPTPSGLGTGYYRARLVLDSHTGEASGQGSFIVHPGSCYTAGEALAEHRRFGIWTHLYSLRGGHDWGTGDMGDLQELVDFARESRAAFVGINPLHALYNRGGDISPYSPVSRLFRNTIYIDITQVPELADCPEAESLINSPFYLEALASSRKRSHVDYEAVMALKRPVFRALHRTFVARHRDGDTERGRAYEAFLVRHGDALTHFATFLTLADELAGSDWRDWPSAYRDPDSPAVASFRREHFQKFDEQRYLQFELDRQLAIAAKSASSLAVGLYGDLAIGSAANGSDPWMFPGLFLDGATLGAPPDDYAPEGQNWGLPPLDPKRLREDAHRYWIQLVQSALEHMGALRIDHMMGLTRQYWVPADRPATEGAYVRFPAEELLGILALESRRREALIIGEDLGTVPRGFSTLLQRWGILSSRVLYFERDRRGGFLPSRRYSRRALVTANTHDHPPLVGFWEGQDLELRHAAGALSDADELSDAKKQRARDREALLTRLRREGCDLDSQQPPYPSLCAGVHAMLAKTPSPLIGVWLDDLAGEREPLNLPGIGVERYPNWSRRLSKRLGHLRYDETVRRALGGLEEKRGAC